VTHRKPARSLRFGALSRRLQGPATLASDDERVVVLQGALAWAWETNSIRRPDVKCQLAPTPQCRKRETLRLGHRDTIIQISGTGPFEIIYVNLLTIHVRRRSERITWGDNMVLPCHRCCGQTIVSILSAAGSGEFAGAQFKVFRTETSNTQWSWAFRSIYTG